MTKFSQVFKVLFFLFLLHSSFRCDAQQPSPIQDIRFKKLSIEHGLSQSVVNCIVQDSRNFLWFGTEDGLNMYNGYNFKIFKNDFLDSNSISSSHITCMLESRQGELWIGTENGLNVYNPRTGKIKSYKHDDSNPRSIASDNISFLYQDRTNIIWIGTADNGICRFNVETEEVVGEYLRHQRYNKSTLPDNHITAICEDRSGLIWVGTSLGLSVYDRNTDKFKNFEVNPDDPNSLADNGINCIIEAINGYVFIGTNNGLSVYNPESQKITNYRATGEGFALNQINCLYEDRSGKLWIGTNGEGVCVFDQYQKSFTCYNSNLDVPGTLSSSFIHSIYEDKTGTIWIGTWGGGLNLYNPYFDRFTIIQKKPNDPNSISSSDISALCEDSRGVLWVGTFNNGLNKFNPALGTNKLFLPDYKTPNSLSDVYISNLYEDVENKILWIGTPNGLNALDLNTDKIKSYYNSASDAFSISSNDINTIYKDKSGIIWIGTGNGLNAMSTGQNKFRRYYFSRENSTSNSYNDVSAICEDTTTGVLWIGTDGSGLRTLNPQTGEIKVYQYSEKNPNSLSNNTVNHIYIDSYNVLWVSTSNGLNAFNPQTGGFEYFTEHEGLPNNVVYGVLEDKSRKLWLSTNNGLCSFVSPHKQRIESAAEEGGDVLEIVNPLTKKYDIKDGLPSNEFNQSALAKGHDGMLYFGGILGVVAFNPDSIRFNPNVPPVYITSFKLFEKEFDMDTTISFKKVIHLNYDQNIFSFEFVTLNFIASEKNEYAFMMEGLDKDWVFSKSRNYASYTNVDPGTYTFRVIAGNNDGVWNEEGASVTIIIHPPFYRTTWFYVLCLLFLIAAIVVYIRWRERALTFQKKILEKKVAERTRQLKREKDRVELAYMQIDNKNKEITDSIKYAKRLQEAILMPEKEIKKHLPESFILYKPKDIVSGDFYYFNKAINGDIIISAVDCTGHGVPGAFMSIVGNNLLNQAIIGNKKTKPSDILDELNAGLSETLKQTLTEASVKDGMDMALCAINLNAKKLQYAGAYNPIWLVRHGIVDSDLVMQERAFPVDKDMLEIRADKFPVGKFIDDTPHFFTNHEMQLQKGDTFYIFSDGYADQFGGMKAKKFKYKRLRELLTSIQDKSMAEQKEILDRRFENWKGELEQVDDILIIGVRMV